MSSRQIAAAHPHRLVAGVLLLTVVIWGVCLLSIADQIGKPFPGFFYSPDRIVSSFTPRDFAGYQQGLRPWDRIVEVNGLHWRQMRSQVRQAGIGGIVVYTVERRGQRLRVPVPTMEFTFSYMLRFLPAYLLAAAVFLSVGIFVYTRNPYSSLNRYLLLYLLIWAAGMIFAWESYLSQWKLATYLLYPYAIATPLAGGIFFWSFPADRARRAFLGRWPLTRAFIIFGLAASLYADGLLALASILDRPVLWSIHLLSLTWGYFVVFQLGTIVYKFLPLVLIVWRSGSASRMRQQAAVMLLGLCLGMAGWYLFIWLPGVIHMPLAANPQWGAILAIFYPLSIGYAILRYQLFNIRVVIRKGLVYSLMTATLTAVFLLLSLLIGRLFQGLSGQQSLLAAALSALAVAFFFQPLRRRFQALVDRAFFRHEVEVRQALSEFTGELSTLRETAEVVRVVQETVQEVLGAERVILWLQGDGCYLPARSAASGSVPSSGEPSVLGSALSSWLDDTRRPLVRVPDDDSPAVLELERLQAVAAVPLAMGGRLLGVLTLGEKRSGDLYGQDDLELLVTLANGTALALENARLHEERVGMLRRQLGQVTSAQEEERRRIARELHDGVAPALAGMGIRLRTARKLLDKDPRAVGEELEEIAEQAQGNIQDIRRLIHDLRPAALDELGLSAALQEYASRFQREQGLEVSLSLPAEEERLPSAMETALFRIVQEALANAARHARARRVEVRLGREGTQILLQVSDDGQGFDPAAPRASTHVGLWSMQERAIQLGGEARIQSAPGRGTRITISLPAARGE